jgi:hypothetical protein
VPSTELSWGNETSGSVDTSRFDPSAFLRDFYWGEERQEGGRTVRREYVRSETGLPAYSLLGSRL